MRFRPLPRFFEDQPIWGSSSGRFTFVITQDELNGFTASVKVKSAVPFDGSCHDLGGYCAHKSFVSAERACLQFLHDNRHVN